MKAKTVYIINPWTGQTSSPLTWAEVRKWAKAHVHKSDLPAWTKAARIAFEADDGITLGRMIIGA